MIVYLHLVLQQGSNISQAHGNLAQGPVLFVVLGESWDTTPFNRADTPRAGLETVLTECMMALT